MAKKAKEQIRDSVQNEGAFGAFHDYIKANEDKADFIIVNHAKGAIQRHD